MLYVLWVEGALSLWPVSGMNGLPVAELLTLQWLPCTAPRWRTMQLSLYHCSLSVFGFAAGCINSYPAAVCAAHGLQAEYLQ